MKKTITIKCTMEERWYSAFLGFLQRLQLDGSCGHSETVGFFADGDGDFRPEFLYFPDPDTLELKHGFDAGFESNKKVDILFDAD